MKEDAHDDKAPGHEDAGRVKREAALREGETRYKALFDSSMDAVLVVDADGKIENANMEACLMFGYTGGELRGMNKDQLHDLADPRLKDLMEERDRTGRARGEMTLVRKDGTRFEGEVSTALHMEDWLLKASVVIRDVTEKKQFEKDRADFLAMVTHDLKSPLTAIIGYSELLLTAKRDILDEDSAGMLEVVRQSGEKLMGMVEDFVTISKYESGGLQPNVMPEDVSEILTGLKDAYKPLAEKAGVNFLFKITDPMPMAMVDRARIERVVGNLLENAFTYTPAGGSVTLSSGERDGQIYISVEDTGPGIPGEDIEKIFEKYYRSKTAGKKGTGLGLATVKAIIEAHGGRAEVRSEPGRGSVFTVILPVRQQEKKAA